MAYIKQAWQNNPPSTATPISAARLNHLETQYDEALAQVAADIADPDSDIGTELSTTIGEVAVPQDGTVSVPVKASNQPATNFVDSQENLGIPVRIEHHGGGNAFDISNRPGSHTAIVVHQYSNAGPGVRLDNTSTNDMLVIAQTNNPILNPDSGPDDDATGNAIRIVDHSGNTWLRLDGRASLIMTPPASATIPAIDIQGNSAATGTAARLINLKQNGPGSALYIGQQAGGDGQYPMMIAGRTHGAQITKSQNGGQTLRLTDSSTGSGDVLDVRNDGTGRSILIRQGTTEVAKVNADGEYELMTAGKGIILKAPDGTRYRIRVTDAGVVEAVAA